LLPRISNSHENQRKTKISKNCEQVTVASNENVERGCCADTSGAHLGKVAWVVRTTGDDQRHDETVQANRSAEAENCDLADVQLPSIALVGYLSGPTSKANVFGVVELGTVSRRLNSDLSCDSSGAAGG
jgi:hypothetical protein